MFKQIAAAALGVAALATASVLYARQESRPKFTGADYFEIADLYARYTRAVDMGGCWGDNDGCTPYKDVFATPAGSKLSRIPGMSPSRASYHWKICFFLFTSSSMRDNCALPNAAVRLLIRYLKPISSVTKYR